MFGKLKEKLKKVVDSFSEEVKEEDIKKTEEVKKEKVEEKPPILESEDIDKEESKESFKETEDKEKPTEEKAGGFSLFSKKLTEEDISDFLFELEIILLENNVALEVAQKITKDLKEKLVGENVKRGKIKELIENTLRESIKEILSFEDLGLEQKSNEKKPYIIIFIGFNGSGKTTTLAKIGKYLIDKGKTVVFAAGDSFRAAAIEQLEEHGKNLGVKVIKHKYGADSAAVIFDAINYAKSKGIDFVLADTAGRVHTDTNLIAELKKIIKVNKPDMNIFVAESISGNDIVEQARVFDEVGIDGIILTKADVDEKGGTALSLAHTLKKPILFFGTGQNYNDLEKFDIEKVLERII